jgi:hypothetical protein
MDREYRFVDEGLGGLTILEEIIAAAEVEPLVKVEPKIEIEPVVKTEPIVETNSAVVKVEPVVKSEPVVEIPKTLAKKRIKKTIEYGDVGGQLRPIGIIEEEI